MTRDHTYGFRAVLAPVTSAKSAAIAPSSGPHVSSSATKDAPFANSLGMAGISTSEDIRDIEVINLDGLPEAEALRLLGVDAQGSRGIAPETSEKQAAAASTLINRIGIKLCCMRNDEAAAVASAAALTRPAASTRPASAGGS